jgi:hypothetical protein
MLHFPSNYIIFTKNQYTFVPLFFFSLVHLDIITVLLPTDAQENCFKRSINIYITTSPTCSGALYEPAKVTVDKPVRFGTVRQTYTSKYRILTECLWNEWYPSNRAFFFYGLYILGQFRMWLRVTLCNKSLMKQQFVVTHRYTCLQETQNNRSSAPPSLAAAKGVGVPVPNFISSTAIPP